MTISSSTSKSGPYTGNGITTSFSYTFQVDDETHLQVIRGNANNTSTTLVLTTDYTVAGVGEAAGGSIVLVSAAEAPTGSMITILRDVPFTQLLDLQNQGAYNAEDVEAALDLLTVRDQQMQEVLSRAVTIPPDGDPTDLDTLSANLATLAGITDAISTVATVADEVVIVAGVADEIPSVAPNTAIASAAATTASAAANSATASASSASQSAAAAAQSSATAKINWRGGWATGTAYTTGDAASDAGSSYFCKLAHTSGSTTRPGVGASWATYWDLMAAKGTAGIGSGDMMASIYDPTGKDGDAFARANHTGTQAISTVINLQSALDAKLAIASNLSDVPNKATALNNLGAAPVDDAHLTGEPTAPTTATSDNSTRIANTAMVQSVGNTKETLGQQAGINTQTGATYTFVLADAGKVVEGNRATAIAMTVPPNSSVAFPINTRIDLIQLGAGQLSLVAASGVTIRSVGGNLKFTSQYSGGTIYKRGTNEWVLVGDLTS